MALQPRTTLNEHPKQQNRKATSIHDMCTAAFVINEINYRIYAMNLSDCTIVNNSTSQYVFHKDTGSDNFYFIYNEQYYYLTPTMNAPGLTNFPEFYISDFINNYHTDLFLTTMQSYIQQSMYVLVQTFKDYHFYCLLNDLLQIDNYISYYGYQFLTDESTINQKAKITYLIKGENKKNTRNVNSIEDSIKSFVVDAHITTGVHADLTNKQFRQLIAQAYKYHRTYDKWFGLQYVPWANSDSETSDIVYCNNKGDAVTDADYDSTDKDVYTEIRYEYGENRYPIRTIEPITPSIEYRQYQFEKAMKYLDTEGLVTDDYKFTHPENFLLWFHRVTEILCTNTVKSLVELMTKVENEHCYCDDYLNTSIKVLYDEIDFISYCYYCIFDKTLGERTIGWCINKTFENQSINQHLTRFNFYINWDSTFKNQVWNETNGYYKDKTGITNGDQRSRLWTSIYDIIPDLVFKS